MNSLLLYDYISRLGASHPQRVLVVFNSVAPPVAEIYEARLCEFLADRRTPDVLYFVGQHSDLPRYKALLESELLLSRIEGRAGISLPPEYRFLLFNPGKRRYEFFSRDGLLLELPDVEVELNELRHSGLQHIFLTRGGMLMGSLAHHYEKPSGKHSDNFIRTANVLGNSAEVTFIAYWLQQYVTEAIRRIYCDTSSINVVGFALNQLQCSYAPEAVPLTIESFNSYDAVENFRFHQIKHSLVLISATTSGDLEKKIAERGAEETNIVTLFFVGKSLPKYHLLCDLTRSPKNNEGVLPIRSYDGDSCSLCRAGSVPVMIFGDQFLPEKPKAERVRIRKSDAPEKLAAFMGEFARKQAFRVSHQETNGTRVFESYLDIDHVLSQPEAFRRFHDDLERVLKKAVPVSLGNIIYLDDPASRKLAEKVSDAFGKQWDCLPGVYSEQEIGNCKTNADAATIVVAGSVSHGRHLMAINRSLRHIQPTGTIAYIVGLVRADSKSSFEEIRSNLTYGDYGPDTFGFYCVRNYCFPLPVAEGGPWKDELAFLKRVIDFCRTNDIPVVDWFKERKALLERGIAKGLIDEIFWPAHDLNSRPYALKIRENFVFFDTTSDCSSVSQADVYAAINLVLHNLRRGSGGELPKLQFQHHRKVIAPINFDRFNDGIIQTALLRAARKHELQYSDELELSEQVKDVILDNIRFAGEDRGEAVGEFVLALGMNKLCLARDHVQEIAKAIQTSTQLPDYFKILAVYLERHH